VAGRLGNKFFLAWADASVGYVALHRGDLATARDRLGTSIALCDEVGDPITRWLAICWLGEIDALTGDFARAQARYEEVLHKGLVSEGDLARHWAIPDLGSLMLAIDDIASAAAVIDPVVAEFEDELPMVSIPFLCAHAELLLARNDAVGAHVILDKARDKATGIDNGPLSAQVDHQLGRLARTEGESAEAEHLFHRALSVCHEHRLVPGIVAALEALAGIAVEQESTTEAARLFGATAAIRGASGLVRRPADQSGFEQDVARVRQQLDETFAATWAEGESLTVDEVVAYASRARGERRRPSSGWTSLTPMEVEVVKLAAKGLTNPEIGDRLFIGRSTVKTHLAHVFTKLGVSSRAELAAEATRRGF
jgi:DNA-binding CsgD family transcriptional regulator